MPTPGLTRRASLLLPLLLAACGGGEEPQDFPALRYSYLPPIRLNVASVDIEQRFVPSGIAPDVSQRAPVRPVEALRAMAEDRLQAFGTAGRAVFSILDASLTRRRDVIDGSMAVRLDVFGPDNVRAGFAEARITRQHTGDVDNLSSTLYDMVKAEMDAMNVEFEYQVRRALRPWLTSGTAPAAPVEQAPLGSPGTAAPPMSGPPTSGGPMPTPLPDGTPVGAPPSSGYPPLPSSGYPPGPSTP